MQLPLILQAQSELNFYIYTSFSHTPVKNIEIVVPIKINGPNEIVSLRFFLFVNNILLQILFV